MGFHSLSNLKYYGNTSSYNACFFSHRNLLGSCNDIFHYLKIVIWNKKQTTLVDRMRVIKIFIISAAGFEPVTSGI